jgi:hypothetical protein
MADETTSTAAPAAETAAQPAQSAPAADGDATGKQAGGDAKTFTQAEVEALIRERVAREQKKATDAAEKARTDAKRKADEEAGEFKKLYDQSQIELATAKAEAHAATLRALRRDVAAKTSLPAALAERLQGETEEELEADAKALLAALPKPAAPNINGANGGNGQTPGKNEAARREYEQWIRRQ